ncbi:MAG: NmrA family NAD(P)-binding protein [Spirochaetales bacterium]|nr:NmrA family NAD(P)-binding protein [Spirochaetales bacterium]
MSEKYFVTGATGNVGDQVVKHLRKKGKNVVAAKLPHETTEDSVNLVYKNFDFNNPDTWTECLKGVTRVFLMRPPHISNIKRDMYPFMEYMKNSEIEQVVFLSVQGVENNKIIPHYKVEKYIEKLDLPHTFIRPSFFMQNLTTTHLSEIRDEKMVFVPTGEGRTNFIDVRDIGEVMALMFLNDRHLNKAYTITGGKSYSYSEVAGCLSKGLDLDIKFINANPISFFSYHLKRKRKIGMTLVMLALYSVVKSGKGDITTSISEAILGRKTIGLDQFITDHKSLLLGENI